MRYDEADMPSFILQEASYPQLQAPPSSGNDIARFQQVLAVPVISFEMNLYFRYGFSCCGSYFEGGTATGYTGLGLEEQLWRLVEICPKKVKLEGGGKKLIC